MQTLETKFKLSREYLTECFDETQPYAKEQKYKFAFPIIAGIAGLAILVLNGHSKTPGAILLALAALELVHLKYRRTWWLWRQLWGKTANAWVQLKLNDQGVQTSSMGNKTKLAWEQIQELIETEAGFILVEENGQQHYLSKSVFTDEMIHYLISNTKKTAD